MYVCVSGTYVREWVRARACERFIVVVVVLETENGNRKLQQ